MKRADYKCRACNKVWEHWISSGSFPELISCHNCGMPALRHYSTSNVSTRVIQGRMGNNKTGYETNPGYFKKT